MFCFIFCFILPPPPTPPPAGTRLTHKAVARVVEFVAADLRLVLEVGLEPACAPFVQHNSISVGNIYNSVPYVYGRTHLGTETTP